MNIERGARVQDQLSGRVGTVVDESSRPGSWLVQFDGATVADRIPAKDLILTTANAALNRFDRLHQHDSGRVLSPAEIAARNIQSEAPAVERELAPGELPVSGGSFVPTITREENPSSGAEQWVFWYPKGKKQFFGLVGMVRLRDQRRRYVGELARRSGLHISESQVQCPDPDPLEPEEVPVYVTPAVEEEPAESPADESEVSPESPATSAAEQKVDRLESANDEVFDAATVKCGCGRPSSHRGRCSSRRKDSMSADPPNVIDSDREKKLEEAFANGATLREAAKLAGVAKGTAQSRSGQFSDSLLCACGKPAGHVGRNRFCIEKESSTSVSERIEHRIETTTTERTAVIAPAVAYQSPTPSNPPSALMNLPTVADEPIDSPLPEYPEEARELLETAIALWAGPKLDDGSYERLLENMETLSIKVKRYRDAKKLTDQTLSKWLGENRVSLAAEIVDGLWNCMNTAVLGAMNRA